MLVIDGREVKFDLSPEQRVAAGVEWLDNVRPGWDREVDLTTIDLANACTCVLGQIVVQEVQNHESVISDEWYEDLLDDGFGAICDPGDDLRNILVDVDDLTSIILTEAQAVNRGFHLFWRDQEGNNRRREHIDAEWQTLTNIWRGVIEARRGA